MIMSTDAKLLPEQPSLDVSDLDIRVSGMPQVSAKNIPQGATHGTSSPVYRWNAARTVVQSSDRRGSTFVRGSRNSDIGATRGRRATGLERLHYRTGS